MRIDLESMSLPDLKKHQAAVEAEILLRGSESRNANRYSLFQHWYQAFGEIMLSDQGIQTPPAAVFAKQAYAKTFTSAMPSCESLVEEFRKPSGPVLRRHQEVKARRAVFRALFVWLSARQVPISIATVCRNMQNSQAAIASEYPGYVQNSLLHMLIQ